jgi:TetR/AcrR family transcriptional regulator, copper-responsive repressor
MTESTARNTARGRPRKFDKEVVLGLIVKTFWAKGYSGTSLDDLAAATGLGRPSLYAAYGNKLSMYLAALEVFGQRMATEAVGQVATASDLKEGLEKFYEAALDIYLGKDVEMKQGCLVFTTAVTEATTEPKIKQMVSAQLAGLDQALTAQIEQHLGAQDPATIAAASNLAAGTLLNLATRARAGTPRPALEDIAATTVHTILSLTQPSP